MGQLEDFPIGSTEVLPAITFPVSLPGADEFSACLRQGRDGLVDVLYQQAGHHPLDRELLGRLAGARTEDLQGVPGVPSPNARQLVTLQDDSSAPR